MVKRKLYYGLTPKPIGTRLATPIQALSHHQVRHYGELAVPVKTLVRYRKAKGGAKGKSTRKSPKPRKSVVKKTTTRKRRTSKK